MYAVIIHIFIDEPRDASFNPAFFLLQIVYNAFCEIFFL